MSSWKKVGEIGVDAGLVYIGDPCYFWHDKRDFSKHGIKDDGPELDTSDWVTFLETHIHSHLGHITQLNYKNGYPGLGVVTTSGYGDGLYDVFAKFTKDGSVKEIKVVFLGDDE